MNIVLWPRGIFGRQGQCHVWMLIHQETKHMRLSLAACWDQCTNLRQRSKPCTAVTQGGVTDHFEPLWWGWVKGGRVIPIDITILGWSGPQLSALLVLAQHVSLHPTLKVTSVMWAHTATAHYPTLICVLAPLKIIWFIFEKNGGLYVKDRQCCHVFCAQNCLLWQTFVHVAHCLLFFLGAKPKHQTKPVNKSPLTKPQKSDTTKTSRWALHLSLRCLSVCFLIRSVYSLNCLVWHLKV